MDVTLRPAFNSLAGQFSSINTTDSESGALVKGANSAPIPCIPFSYRDGYNISKENATISPVLPPKPNVKLCTCMMQTLNCIKDPIVPIETALSTRTKLCKQNEDWCKPHYSDTHKGLYQAYWLCNYTEIVSLVLDRFYIAYDHDVSACTSGGGIIQTPTPLDKMTEVCRTLLAQAGPDGMGNVTYNPYPLGEDTRMPLLREVERGGGLVDTTAATATRAAIGVGVAAALAFAALFAWLFVRRRRRRRKEVETKSAAANDDAQQSSSDAAAAAAEGEDPVLEMAPGRELVEIDGIRAQQHQFGDAQAQRDMPHELSATMQIEPLAELESSEMLSRRLQARQKEIESYGGYNKWLRVQGN
jgi:hypothetical protein